MWVASGLADITMPGDPFLFGRLMRTYLKIADSEKCRHTRESGYPEKAEKHWIPVYTGMTPKGG
jgi:hypothetical protein